MTKIQAEFSRSYGSLIPSIRADTTVYQIDSFDPKYSKIVVKQGSNPQPPDNSVIINKMVQDTGIITLTCGILAVNMDRIQNTVDAQPAAGTNGILMQSQKIAALMRAQDANPNGAVGKTIIQTVKYEKPTSPLDSERAAANQMNNLLTQMPGLVATRSFVGGGGISDSDDPDAIIHELPPSMQFSYIIIVLVIIAIWFVIWARVPQKILKVMTRPKEQTEARN